MNPTSPIYPICSAWVGKNRFDIQRTQGSTLRSAKSGTLGSQLRSVGVEAVVGVTADDEPNGVDRLVTFVE